MTITSGNVGWSRPPSVIALSYLTGIVTGQGLFFPQNFVKLCVSFLIVDHLAFSRIYLLIHPYRSSYILLMTQSLTSFPRDSKSPTPLLLHSPDQLNQNWLMGSRRTGMLANSPKEIFLSLGHERFGSLKIRMLTP